MEDNKITKRQYSTARRVVWFSLIVVVMYVIWTQFSMVFFEGFTPDSDITELIKVIFGIELGVMAVKKILDNRLIANVKLKPKKIKRLVKGR